MSETDLDTFTTDPNRLPTQRRTAGAPSDTWSALKAAAPEVGEVLGTLGDDRQRVSDLHQYADYPGFRQWLLANFALNVPTRTIRDDLAQIVSDQGEDGLMLRWPTLSKRQLDTARYDLQIEWAPIEARLTAAIESVGVLGKNRRLLALAQLAERLADAMWEERNTRTGQLYLHGEFRNVLRQIAEEKGELGEERDSAVDKLGEVALALAEAFKVQGSGLQNQEHKGEAFDYERAAREVDEAEILGEWRESVEEAAE